MLPCVVMCNSLCPHDDCVPVSLEQGMHTSSIVIQILCVELHSVTRRKQQRPDIATYDIRHCFLCLTRKAWQTQKQQQTSYELPVYLMPCAVKLMPCHAVAWQTNDRMWLRNFAIP